MSNVFSEFNRMLASAATPNNEGSSLSRVITGQKNELIIFAPMSFKDHPSAKLLYNFVGYDTHLGEDKLQKIIEKAHNKDGNIEKNNFNHDLNEEAFDYFGINRDVHNPERTSKLSDYWSFLYISHSPKNTFDSATDTNLIGMENLRVVTYGFFDDIPIGMGNTDTNRSYNLAVRLVPTHKTVMTARNIHNAFGQETNYSTVLNVDIYNSRFSGLLIDPLESKYLLTPNNEDQITKDTYISTNFFDPKTQMTSIVKGLNEAFNSEICSRNDTLNESIGISYGIGTDNLYSQISNTSVKQNIKNVFDIDKRNLEFHRQYTHIHDFGSTTLGDLMTKFGLQDVDIEVIQISNSSFVNDSVDTTQSLDSRYDYSSMISSMCNSFMHNEQISSIAFRYSSYGDIYEISDEQLPQSIIPIEQNKFKMKILRFIQHLKKRLFTWIRKDIGEFELSVSLNICGNSYIKLDPYSHTSHKDEYVVIPTITGGLSVPTLGGISQVEQNSGQIDALSDMVSHEKDIDIFN